jgi:hypothetical protein
MMMSLGRWLFLCVLLAAGLSACGTTEPYVYKHNEFDRKSPDFGKKLEDRVSVIICYNKWDTTPEQVFDLASVECGKFGKMARAFDQEFGNCPLLVPMAAQFVCVKP